MPEVPRSSLTFVRYEDVDGGGADGVMRVMQITVLHFTGVTCHAEQAGVGHRDEVEDVKPKAPEQEHLFEAALVALLLNLRRALVHPMSDHHHADLVPQLV